MSVAWSRKFTVVIKKLVESGIKRYNVTVIFACGTHPKLNREKMVNKIGARIVQTMQVQNHDPTKDLVEVGETTRGTKVIFEQVLRGI